MDPISLNFKAFCIFWFINGCSLHTPRPGDLATCNFGFWQDIQRLFYYDYFMAHTRALKVQVVYLPMRIIWSVIIGPMRENNNGTQSIVSLNFYLVELLHGHLVGELGSCLFGNDILCLLVTTMPRFNKPTPDLRILNQHLLGLRKIDEHVFADRHILILIIDILSKYSS